MDFSSLTTDVTVQPRVDLGILIIRWMTNTASSRVKSIYLSVLDICVQSSFDKVLIDLRRREYQDDEVAAWFFSDYIDLICTKLDTGLKISFLVTPYIMSYVKDGNKNYSKLTCKVHVFDT